MTFSKGLKGANGKNNNGRKQGSRRRRLGTRKVSNKSTSVTPVTNIPNPNPNPNLTKLNDNTPATPAAREQLPRASKDSDRVQFMPLSDDESDGDAYVQHEQEISDEYLRTYILTQYVSLGSPDIEEWDDFFEEEGTISRIENALLGEIKSSYLFRRQIKRVLTKIRECWIKGDDYCPKADSSKAGRPAIIEVYSAVANMIADIHEKNQR